MQMNWSSFATGAALGAGAMFLLDPDRGRRRRALVRDKAVWGAHKTADGVDALSRDVANRARGVAAEVQARFSGDETADARKLSERVRAELGRVVSHPRAIDVWSSADGRVTVAGPILSWEAERALAAIRGVRGVREVVDQFERHDSSEGVPSLQGEGSRVTRRSSTLTGPWSPTAKLALGVTGAILAAGLTGRSRPNPAR